MIREGLAAVLASVERDYVVRPAAEEPDSVATYGPDKPRWRCNRVTRCVLPDGHDGGHAYTGETR